MGPDPRRDRCGVLDEPGHHLTLGTRGVLATFARAYTDDLDATVAGLQACGAGEVRLRFGHASGLELALVGDVLVLAGPDDVLAPFRATAVTMIVADLDATLAAARAIGAATVRDVAEQPTGRNATVRLAGGVVVEFVEWDAATRQHARL